MMNDKIIKYYLIFQPGCKYFQFFIDAKYIILSYKLRGLSEESIITHATSKNNFTIKIAFIHNSKILVKFEENCLKQDNIFLLMEMW